MLARSWRRAWPSAGDAGQPLFDEMCSRYGEAHRAYHTLRHLAECIAALEPVLPLATHPAEVEIALWFHDAFYDVTRQDNESRSAHRARTAMLDAGFDAHSAQRVHDLVMATRHAEAPRTRDQELLVDIDLAILGAHPDRFDEYEEQIRREYASVPEALFRDKRRAVLETFLGRPFIYATGHFRGSLEAPARANLRRSLVRLGSVTG